MRLPFAPMLAVKAEPFDSPEYLFEVKWDGVRALAGRDANGWRLWGRELADYRLRYPELAALAALPEGTVLDGEIVLLSGGVPDLKALLARHGLSAARTAQARGQPRPVTYVVFDAPYALGRCLFGRPLAERREAAREQVRALADARVVFSEGVVGAGRAFFARAVAAGQEGVLAKHLASRYQPGRRCAAWRKIKPTGRVPAVVIGYEPGPRGVRSLQVAALCAGQLRYVACLRRGLRGPVRRRLAELLAGRVRARPVVPCPGPAVWVEPGVYCWVQCLGWTPAARRRGARFLGLIDSP
jgi:bifunctional non-homologous end joining protein LigD/DNA ligase-1